MAKGWDSKGSEFWREFEIPGYFPMTVLALKSPRLPCICMHEGSQSPWNAAGRASHSAMHSTRPRAAVKTILRILLTRSRLAHASRSKRDVGHVLPHSRPTLSAIFKNKRASRQRGLFVFECAKRRDSNENSRPRRTRRPGAFDEVRRAGSAAERIVRPGVSRAGGEDDGGRIPLFMTKGWNSKGSEFWRELPDSRLPQEISKKNSPKQTQADHEDRDKGKHPHQGK